MQYRWKWSILFEPPYLNWLLTGLAWTVLIAVAALLLALLVGCGVGVLRTPRSRWARYTGTAYVEIFRNIPLLVQLFVWYFVLPEVLPQPAGDWIKRDLPYPEYWTAVVGIGLFSAARVAELVRAGIGAAGAGQAMAAAAMGMSPGQTYRHVLLPIAARHVLPPLTSEFLNIIKNSSLALTIGVLELTGQSRQIESNTFQGIEAMTAATTIYVALAIAVISIMRLVEKRIALPRSTGKA